MISLDKRQPKYLYNLNLALTLFFILWFALGVPLMITVGCIYDESVITYIVMCCTFAVFFIGLAIFIVVDKKLNKRLIEERTAQIEEEFTDMPFEEAERILKERGIITDSGFVVKSDVFGEEVAPFEEVWIDLYFSLAASEKIDICLFSNKSSFKRIAKYSLDCAMYNFLVNKNTGIKSNTVFNLLVKDKKAFAQWALYPAKIIHSKAAIYKGLHGTHDC